MEGALSVAEPRMVRYGEGLHWMENGLKLIVFGSVNATAQNG